MNVHSEVQKYYSEDVKKTSDLKTGACLTSGTVPVVIRNILSVIHDDVISKYYGCGLTIPKEFSLLQGMHVLDLGSGAGRDVYILSKLVGAEGKVFGLDMTAEQVATAQKHIMYHTEKFGYATPNVDFRVGFIENLQDAGFKDDSLDLVVSNCVINLSPNKSKVLGEVYRVLRNGGEFYFSDVYADRRIPDSLQKDRVLWGECLSGALYQRDFERMAQEAGFAAPRIVDIKPLNVGNTGLESRLGGIVFSSVTYRLVKVDGLEHRCEDYGQAVNYAGTVSEALATLSFDREHTFSKGKIQPVCRNTYRMLRHSRFGSHFKFYPEIEMDTDIHFGAFVDNSAPKVALAASDGSCGKESSCSGGSCC